MLINVLSAKCTYYYYFLELRCTLNFLSCFTKPFPKSCSMWSNSSSLLCYFILYFFFFYVIESILETTLRQPLLISSILNLSTCRYFQLCAATILHCHHENSPLSLSFRVHPFLLPSIFQFCFIYSLSWSISFNSFLRNDVYEGNSQGL